MWVDTGVGLRLACVTKQLVNAYGWRMTQRIVKSRRRSINSHLNKTVNWHVQTARDLLAFIVKNVKSDRGCAGLCIYIYRATSTERGTSQATLPRRSQIWLLSNSSWPWLALHGSQLSGCKMLTPSTKLSLPKMTNRLARMWEFTDPFPHPASSTLNILLVLITKNLIFIIGYLPNLSSTAVSFFW